jgi:spore maturation protein CgeB
VRLLISGAKTNENTVSSFIIKNFDGSFAYEILEFPDKFATLLQSKLYRFLYRFFPILVIRRMDRIFLKQVADFKPTVILIFKGMEISKWSLAKIRRQNIKLVNYNFDHPFHFFSRGTGNRFVKEAIPYYDLHISYSARIAKELHAKFNVKAVSLPFGFHITDDQFQAVVNENRPEINRVCFVGNPDQWRISILKKMLRDGISVDVYGFGWEKYFNSTERLCIHKPRQSRSFWSDPDEFWKVLRQYRIQLNFFRPHNEGSHNLRTFEVPAVGGILLTPESEEQTLFFEEGKEIFFYSDYESLLSQCKLLLAKDQQWIEGIRSNARSRSVASDYSYKRRTGDLLFLLENLNRD